MIDWKATATEDPPEGEILLAIQQIGNKYSVPSLVSWKDGVWYWEPEGHSCSVYWSHWVVYNRPAELD